MGKRGPPLVNAIFIMLWDTFQTNLSSGPQCEPTDWRMNENVIKMPFIVVLSIKCGKCRPRTLSRVMAHIFSHVMVTGRVLEYWVLEGHSEQEGIQQNLLFC